jgi:MFS family permease
MALYGFGHGGFFAVVSPTVAAYFGMKEHGALFGTILFFGTISGSIGPILTGFVFDHFGSYEIAFWGLLGLMLAGLLLVLALPSKDIDTKSEPKN